LKHRGTIITSILKCLIRYNWYLELLCACSIQKPMPLRCANSFPRQDKVPCQSRWGQLIHVQVEMSQNKETINLLKWQFAIAIETSERLTGLTQTTWLRSVLCREIQVTHRINLRNSPPPPWHSESLSFGNYSLRRGWLCMGVWI
jgi:hypothetical protein